MVTHLLIHNRTTIVTLLGFLNYRLDYNIRAEIRRHVNKQVLYNEL